MAGFDYREHQAAKSSEGVILETVQNRLADTPFSIVKNVEYASILALLPSLKLSAAENRNSRKLVLVLEQ